MRWGESMTDDRPSRIVSMCAVSNPGEYDRVYALDDDGALWQMRVCYFELRVCSFERDEEKNSWVRVPCDNPPTKEESMGAKAVERLVLRGGDFYENSMFVRCAHRYDYDPESREFAFGFRVVLSAKEKRIEIQNS